MSVAAAAPAQEAGPWIFGRRTDLLAFGGSAALALALLAIGVHQGLTDSPAWLFLGAVIAVDVAHVWSTLFRVYLDAGELRQRPLLYAATPVVVYGVGVAAYSASSTTFWRVLAYVAVFHFVRQQYGWVRLYQRRALHHTRLDSVIDSAAIYLATGYPLLHWHAHLPRQFHWLIEGDFVSGLSEQAVRLLFPLYVVALGGFASRQLGLWARTRSWHPGKSLVVATTAATWWLGLVSYDSDYAFTVTNVLVHGLPYFVITYRHGRSRTFLARLGALAPVAFGLTVVGLALAEEALWDRWVWRDHPWLFGDGPALDPRALALIVPLLAVPQATHYVLDGFIWRARAWRVRPW